MAYKFKVGETYKTRGGEDRMVIYEYPDGTLVATNPGNAWGLGARRSDGKFYDKGRPSEYDLMPPTRKVVFPERWAVRSEKGTFATYLFKEDAEEVKKCGEESSRYYGKIIITHIPELTIEEEYE